MGGERVRRRRPARSAPAHARGSPHRSRERGARSESSCPGRHDARGRPGGGARGGRADPAGPRTVAGPRDAVFRGAWRCRVPSRPIPGVADREAAARLLSKRGASDSLVGLVGQLKRVGVPIIAITGDCDSILARQAEVVLDASVTEEACPDTLAPTTSTTVALALGDALAVVLLEVKGFRREQFAALHPGGALGRHLLLRVADVMLTSDVPTLLPDRPMRECVVLLAEKRGTVAIVDSGGGLVGVVTAGDLTRLMERTDRFLDL